MLKLNESKIRLGGTANIAKPLELGNTYDLTIKDVECREVKDLPNDDGTKNVVSLLRISELSTVTVISEKEAVVASKQGSQSQMVRWLDNQIADEEGADREIHYKEYMDREIENKKEQLENAKFVNIELNNND